MEPAREEGVNLFSHVAFKRYFASFPDLLLVVVSIISPASSNTTFHGFGIGDQKSPEAHLPNKELYIRWLQLATFLPVIRYSVLPSDYSDSQVLEQAKTLTTLRQQIVILYKIQQNRLLQLNFFLCTITIL